MLSTTYKEHTLKRTQVFERYSRFKRGEISPEKAGQIKLAVKIIIVVFFDVRGIVQSKYVPKAKWSIDSFILVFCEDFKWVFD